MKKVTVELSEALDRQIRIQAAYLDMNRSQFVRTALEEKLAELAGSGKATRPKLSVEGPEVGVAHGS